MARDDSAPLALVQGEVIPISLAESVAGLVLFSALIPIGLVFVVVPFWWSLTWYYLVVGGALGVLLIVGGALMTREMLGRITGRERLVIGADRVQIVEGKEPVVTGQLPYANIAEIVAVKADGAGTAHIGVTLRDWNDPETRWPGGVAMYEFRRKEGFHDVTLGMGYTRSPRAILTLIQERRGRPGDVPAPEGGPAILRGTSFKEKILLIKLAVAAVIALVGLGTLYFVIEGGNKRNNPGPPAPTQNREEILAKLKSENPAERGQGCSQLGKYRPMTKENVELLSAALADKDGGVRASAAGALAEIGPMLESQPEWASPAATAAVKALEDPDNGVVLASITVLRHSGAAGKAAMEPLKKQLQARDAERRLAAASALNQLDPATATETLPVVVALLDDPNDAMRLRAVRTIGSLGGAGKGAGPQLVKIATSKQDRNLRIVAAETLLQVDPAEASQAAAALVALIKEIDVETGGILKKPAMTKGADGRIILANPEALGNPLGTVRADALRVLRRADTKAADAVNQ